MQEVIWKNDEVLGFATALVRHALASFEMGVKEFTTDIVPDAERGPCGRPPGHGIAGSVVTMLQTANVIEPVGIVASGTFYAHRVKSERPGAKSRWLNVYRLKGRDLAEAFLRRNEPAKSTTPSQPVNDQ